MTRARALCLFVAACLVAPAGLAAQSLASLLGQPVVSVTFDVEGRIESAGAITNLADVKVGQPLRQPDVRATMAHLDSLGRYESIEVFAAPVPGGVAVTFRLVPRHPVTRLEVRGDVGVDPRDLENFLRQPYGGVPTGVRLPAVEATAVQFLNDAGYLDADVATSTELAHEPEGAALVINVDAGTLARIGSVEVRGTTLVEPADVVRRTGTATGQPFRRRDVESALTLLEDDLRGRGYYEAQATVQTERSLAGVDLVITVDAGPLVELRVTPSDALPGDIDDLIPVRRLGSADQDLLEDARATIERALRAQGYWRAAAPFTRVVDPNANRLVITFTVTRGPRYYVDRVDLPAGLSLSASAIRTLIGISSGDLFDEDRFVRGLAAVVDEYRRAGYYRVQAETAYEEVPGASSERARIALQPRITEGPRGELGRISFDVPGGPHIPETELRAAMRSGPGAPYVESEAARDRSTLQTLYLDRGFRSAQVQVRPGFGADGRDVTLAVTIDEGRQVRIGQISIVGNDRVSAAAIRDELALSVGAPAGLASINDAQARLIAMGVFRRVTITAVDQFTEPETHLIVNVVESPGTTVGFGGGLEGGRFNDRLEFAPRGFFEVSRRNLGGRNRVLSFFSRGSLRRNDGSLPDATTDDGGFGFAEYRVTGTFRERRAFRSDTDLLFGVTSEQAVRTTFNFIRRGINAEILRSFGAQVSVSGRYQLEFTRLFDERFGEEDQPLIDRAFPQVRLSTFSTGVGWDRRDNLLSPTRGSFVTADFQVAGRAVGSEVGFLKTFLQGSIYRTLSTRQRTVIAGRAEIGMARGFARSAIVIDDNGQGVPITVEDLPASQRFFAGGSTTVRGFQIDRLAVPELLNEENGLPLGGNALVVFNLEVRRPVTTLFGRSLGAVAFADAGNVFRRAGDLDLGLLRSAIGFGVRYDSPLGPLRLDFGFKVRPEIINNRRERGWEYHLSIGEAF
jgi:outer membrane protein assembly complex protein YaeT